MSASGPDPRYYKDGRGLHPRWRLFFRHPRFYLWMVLPMPLKRVRFAVQRWKRRNDPPVTFTSKEASK